MVFKIEKNESVLIIFLKKKIEIFEKKINKNVFTLYTFKLNNIKITIIFIK